MADRLPVPPPSRGGLYGRMIRAEARRPVVVDRTVTHNATVTHAVTHKTEGVTHSAAERQRVWRERHGEEARSKNRERMRQKRSKNNSDGKA